MSPLPRPRRFAVVLVGSLVALLPAAADEPVLDIVVATSLKTPKEHAEAYRQGLHEEAAAALTTLMPPTYPENGQAPPDGAAPFRLFIDHQGTVAVGNALKVVGVHPTKVEALGGGQFRIGPDRTKFDTTWYLPYTHRGTVSLRLAEWKGDKYQTRLTWSAVVPDPVADENNKGFVEVASLKQDKAPLDFKPPFPKKLDEARTEALNSILPGELGPGVFQGLVSGRVVKVKPGEETTADVSVTNKSPWPVAKVRVTVLTPANVLVGSEDTELEFAQPLAPGKSGMLSLTGTATPNNTAITGLRPGVMVKGAEFVPGK